jgi:exosortase A
MPPEALRTEDPLKARLLAQVPEAWRMPLLRLASVWLGLILLFRADWSAMARQWWDSSTYNHILLVPAILAWLIAQRVPELVKLRPSVWWPGLVLFAGAGFVWLLGAMSGLSFGTELGAVGLLAASALTLLGPKVGAGLFFPLAYMAALVPIGDELVPALQMITAEITIALVHLSGISAQIDGVFIHTPAGLFEVAEACSGVKFLIAMIAFGVLVANVCFVSWPRRAVFLTFCVAAPILANGVRAWGTVFAAQYVGAEKASGIDHVIYGWVFFGLVIALVLAVSWRFFDRPARDPMIDAAALEQSPLLGQLEAFGLRPALAIAVLTATAIGAQLWAHGADRLEAHLPRQIFLPEVSGWTRVDYAPRIWWEPKGSGAQHRLLGSYADTQGRRVDVFLAAYASQGEGREAGGFGQGALPPGQGWAWLSPGPSAGVAKSDRLLADGRIARLAETYYRTGGVLTGSNSRLKLAAMQNRLLLRARGTTMLILSAEERQGTHAADVLDDFRRSTGPLDAWMDRIVSVR